MISEQRVIERSDETKREKFDRADALMRDAERVLLEASKLYLEASAPGSMRASGRARVALVLAGAIDFEMQTAPADPGNDGGRT